MGKRGKSKKKLPRNDRTEAVIQTAEAMNADFAFVLETLFGRTLSMCEIATKQYLHAVHIQGLVSGRRALLSEKAPEMKMAKIRKTKTKAVITTKTMSEVKLASGVKAKISLTLTCEMPDYAVCPPEILDGVERDVMTADRKLRTVLFGVYVQQFADWLDKHWFANSSIFPMHPLYMECQSYGISR